MRLDLLADPRTHLTCLAVFFGSLLFSPAMSEVAGSVEDRAFGTLDKVGHDARVVLGIVVCDGHLTDDPGGSLAFEGHRCLGARLAGSLPRF